MGLFSPKMPAPMAVAAVQQPTVSQEIVDRNAADIMRRRRGQAANVTGAAAQGTTAGSVAAKSLLGE